MNRFQSPSTIATKYRCKDSSIKNTSRFAKRARAEETDYREKAIRLGKAGRGFERGLQDRPIGSR